MDHELHEHPAHHSPKEKGGVTFTLSARTLFLSGVLVGLVVMGIPTTFFATRALTRVVSAPTPTEVGAVPNAPADAPAKAPGAVKPVSDKDYIRGDKNAKVTLIEYSDYECPFCSRFHPEVKKLLDEYKGKINWVYRHFPLSFHANAQKEAEAAECAGSLGGSDAFWKYTDTIFERTTSTGTGFALDKLVPLAKEIGVDEKKFQECLDGGKMAQKVQQDFADGQAAGVDGTPGTILLTKSGKSALIPGAVPYDTLKSQVDQLLAGE